MKYQAAIAFAVMLTASAAGAQTPPAAPAAAPDAAAAPAGTPAQQAQRDKVKGERQSCRSDAQAKGLKGPALRSAVVECMGQVDPKAAKRMTCAKDGKDKGLAGADLKKSIHQCMTGA